MPRVKWVDLLWALVGMAAAGGLVTVVGGGMHVTVRAFTPVSRAALLSVVFGLAAYIYYGLGLPGSSLLDGIMPGFRGLFLGFAWGLVPLLLVFVLGRLRVR